MDAAFISRLKQLQANPRPTPRKHSYSFYQIRVPCPEGHGIPKDIVAWIHEHMEVHLRRCIEHFFEHVREGYDDDHEKVLQAFLIHQLESTFRDCRPRYQRYAPGKRSYAWFFMFMFNDWIREQYPPKETETDPNFNGVEIFVND